MKNKKFFITDWAQIDGANYHNVKFYYGKNKEDIIGYDLLDKKGAITIKNSLKNNKKYMKETIKNNKQEIKRLEKININLEKKIKNLVKYKK